MTIVPELNAHFRIFSGPENIFPDPGNSFGELSLSGEVRPVPNGEERIKEAEKHGFEYIIVPRANTNKKLIENSKIKILPVTNIMNAIEELRGITQNN